MKVLCLHGKGTSGAIFRSQTCPFPSQFVSQTHIIDFLCAASFRTHLAGRDIEFDFVDGPHRSSPAAGVDLFYNPPYYSFWEADNVDTIRASCAWLSEYIKQNGPYDATLMFSQGCVLGCSMLLLHQEETPHLPPPFKAAIFICGGASLPVLKELGFHVSAEARERDLASRIALGEQSHSSAIQTRGSDRWTGNSLHSGLSEDELRNEIGCPYRISVPTVHIYGSKDPRYAAGVHLSGICDPATRRVYNHGGGHEIPRTDTVSRSIAELVRWAVAQEASS